MNSTDFKINEHCTLPLDKEKSRFNYFVVKTDDGEEYSIPKLKFQKDRPIPDTLDIYIKDIKDGYVYLRQDLSVIIRMFYKEGEEYDFKIKGKKIGKPGNFDVEDDNGLFFSLYNAPSSLTRGQIVKCKIQKIENAYVSLRYAGLLAQEMNLPFVDIDSWLRRINRNPRHSQSLLSWIEMTPGYEDVARQISRSEPRWIFTLLKNYAASITDLLIQARNQEKDWRKLLSFMDMARDIALYIIQKSNYLKTINPEQRALLQKQLSGLVEQFEQFSEAAHMISNKEDEEFIDSIFENLKNSGFLYRPSRQFRIMMTILRLRPELIQSRMNQLFEALHSWPISNWKEEPFRSALVGQLEIYISENCNLVNALPANEELASNQQMNRIIRSIAIQSLLAKRNDNIDLAHNRTMLYRYLSNFRTNDVDDLLYKAVGAILGQEFYAEFTWEDTSRFQLLQEKASHSKGLLLSQLPPKVYLSNNVTIELGQTSISIRQKGGKSVLPNNMLSWLSPTVYVDGEIPTPGARKMKDINAFEEMWASIQNALFTQRDTVTESVKETKRSPEDGEEVYIMIDDYDIDRTKSFEHQLRFHCVIVDDDLKGEGWLTCCKEDMLSWMDETDFVAFNGDMSIFKDENGNPLVYPAKVKNSGEENVFTMKREIDEFLINNAVLCEKSIATIMDIDKTNKRYICLSDRGYSLLVPFDDASANFKTGSKIEVEYLGKNTDRQNSLMQFMNGELVSYISDPDNEPSKTEPFRNLMQALGEPAFDAEEEEENIEVAEAQEIMSEEDVCEVIMMFQRKAYAEREYINAFNYLGFASLLAKCAGRDDIYDEIRLHQKLLKHLQFFARNRSIDHDNLEELQTEVAGHPILQKLFTKLDIVGSIGRPEKNEYLWQLSSEDSDENEKSLASMVISLNILPEDERFNGTRKEIMTSIAGILNLNSRDEELKYYGEEDLFTEFKSSLVYTNKKEDRMMPKPAQQEKEILQIICGFLNAYGGTLYIGVNDAGYECGLEDDKRFRRGKGKKETLDAMKVDLQNAIHNRLTGRAEDVINITTDHESRKGVIRVDIQPLETPQKLDGVYFVRNGSSTRPKLNDDLTDYLSERREKYRNFIRQQQRQSYIVEKSEMERPEQKPIHVIDTSSTPPTPAQVIASTETEENRNRVQTGTHRLNVLHDGFPGFVHPSFYIYFQDDNTFRITTDDTWGDAADNVTLALAINDKEMDGFLVLGYDGGTVVKIPLEKIAATPENKPVALLKGQKLIHANVASRDMQLLTFLQHAESGLAFNRVDAVEDIPESQYPNSKGKTIVDSHYVTLWQDVIDKDKAEFYYNKITEYSAQKRIPGRKLNINQGATVVETIRQQVSEFAAKPE